MERAQIDPKDLERHSGTSVPATAPRPFDPADAAERIRIFGKLFGLYPQRRDPEISLEAYREATNDWSTVWLRWGCLRLIDEPDRIFLPVINEVRKQTAYAFRGWRRHMAGQKMVQYNPHSPDDPIDVDLECRIARGLEPLRSLITQGGRPNAGRIT